MTEVVLEQLSKRYGNIEAVKSIDLTIGRGEFIVLLGPSGCGKTTTLRMIAGLESISGGRVFIGGRDVANVPGKDRNVAMVFQSYALYPHKNVRNNLAFALQLRGESKEEIDRKIAHVARTIGIDQLLDRRPRNLSGGQQQRVALGRAMVRNPDVFLFDEPLSNLDAKLRNVMRGEISKLHASLDATMIYVTHDQNEAMTMADRIVVMNQGWIEQVGTPLEIYDDPKSQFVAGFIGNPSMNLFDGRMETLDGAPAARAGNLKIALPEGCFREIDGEVKIGIRPEFIKTRAATEDGEPATVRAIEQLGSETILHLDTEGPELASKSLRLEEFETGDRVTLSIDPEHVYAFRRGDGRRIPGR